ncbi:hypothetical protein SLEP1_g40867 [Rubroshorea leprosula]|uniref:TF-B3 domain-containing protein n=1 Tax=Rubroshorea leprosula TaxID=152421 RepID=A0AAV5L4R9_9ROSI|nr:hypothetical protein SLEP1_g40867 [Rubroshorea leprosula]
MATIFENKRIESNDLASRMRFPHGANFANLPFGCNNPGQFGSLSVTDEGGTQWTLTIKNQNGQVYFTDGWNAFRVGKGVTVGKKISLYKDEDDRTAE